MNQSNEKQYAFLKEKRQQKYWRDLTADELRYVVAEIGDPARSYMERVTRRLELFLELETPVFLENTQIQGVRTLKSFPKIYAPGEFEKIKESHHIHEDRGQVSNLAWDYAGVLTEGLEGRKERLLNGQKADGEFVRCALRTIAAVEKFADRYGECMKAHGQEKQAEEMRRAVRYGAKTTLQAMQAFRILHFCVWGSGCYHNTVGRFDQWIYPFYSADIENGILTKETALDLLEDFFLSFNRDHDLYLGLKNNGQSIMLAGVKPDGSPAINEISDMCLEASLDLHLVDPKINVRVDKNTSLSFYEKCTRLTKTGLGFPQYSNDDVVIPALVKLGYALEDARNYSVAACWEFIVPGNAMDIPNFGAMPLANLVDQAIREHLTGCDSLSELYGYVEKLMDDEAAGILEKSSNIYIEPSPLMSVLMKDCVDTGKDISEGAKYNNYGLHGTGYACAVDQLAAVESMVFSGKITKERLLRGLNTNFKEDRELRHALRTEAAKLGKDKRAAEIGNDLLGLFADALEGKKNERGGILRAGTGTAMFYIRHAEKLGATADGRDAGAPLPANFSPSLFVTSSGPFSLVSAFAPANIGRAMNGGPLTLEIHRSVFKSEEGISKVAALIRAFVEAGGHQLQLNAVDPEELKDAQLHPENHRDLIVRVWGWSGYFVEIDKIYQDQIVQRHSYGG